MKLRKGLGLLAVLALVSWFSWPQKNGHEVLAHEFLTHPVFHIADAHETLPAVQPVQLALLFQGVDR